MAFGFWLLAFCFCFCFCFKDVAFSLQRKTLQHTLTNHNTGSMPALPALCRYALDDGTMVDGVQYEVTMASTSQLLWYHNITQNDVQEIVTYNDNIILLYYVMLCCIILYYKANSSTRSPWPVNHELYWLLFILPFNGHTLKPYFILYLKKNGLRATLDSRCVFAIGSQKLWCWVLTVPNKIRLECSL